MEKNSPKKKITANEAIETIGFGIPQFLIFLICISFWFFDGIEMNLVSIILLDLKKTWNLNSFQTGFIGSIGFLGMLFGAVGGGFTGDIYGRRLFLILGPLITSISSLASAFSNGYWMFLIARFFTGFGIGGSISSDNVLLAEYMPERHRGWTLVFTMVLQPVGRIYVSFFGWVFLVVLQGGGLIEKWRWLVVVCSIPGFIVTVLKCLVPESPRFLITRGREKKAMETFQMLAKYNRKDLSEFELQPPSLSSLKKLNTGAFQKFRDLFQSRIYTVTTLITFVISAALSYGDWGVGFMTPLLLSIVDTRRSQVMFNNIITGLAAMVGVLLCSLVIHKIPRKLMLALSGLASVIPLILICFWKNSTWVLYMLIIQNVTSAFCWGAVYLYFAEFYPTELRATSWGMGTAGNRVGGFFSLGISTYLQSADYFWPWFWFAIAFVIVALGGLALPRETFGKEMKDFIHRQKHEPPLINTQDHEKLSEDSTKTLLLNETREKH